MHVQIVIAQMITKYVSDVSVSSVPAEKIPWLCESDAIKYPTFPRATIARPSIDAGYKDKDKDLGGIPTVVAGSVVWVGT